VKNRPAAPPSPIEIWEEPGAITKLRVTPPNVTAVSARCWASTSNRRS
jgi:hypothetical protein